MLFVENKTLTHHVSTRGRIQLLKELREKNHVSVIRSARLKAFELLMSDPARDTELEAELVGFGERKNEEAYVGGDLFSADDHVFYIVFDDNSSGDVVRAGIVYNSQSAPNVVSRVMTSSMYFAVCCPGRIPGT